MVEILVSLIVTTVIMLPLAWCLFPGVATTILTNMGAYENPRVNSNFDLEALIDLIEAGVYGVDNETYWFYIYRKVDRYNNLRFFLSKPNGPAHWYRFRLRQENTSGPVIPGLSQRELYRLAYKCSNLDNSGNPDSLSSKLRADLNDHYRGLL